MGVQLTLGTSVLVVIATPGDEQAGRALSAVVHALYEKQQCAVARYVWRAKAQARLVVLRPCIKRDYEVSVGLGVGVGVSVGLGVGVGTSTYVEMASSVLPCCVVNVQWDLQAEFVTRQPSLYCH